MNNPERALSDFRIPILTYHSLHARGRRYSENDHLALESDLEVIRNRGFRIAPLNAIVKSITSVAGHLGAGRWVGISFDDGTDYDFLDTSDPAVGNFKAFYTILCESGQRQRQHEHGEWPQPTATSFAIASPDARETLDRTCIAGRGNWRDCWWNEAARTNIISIGNHSWDHVHDTLDVVAQREQRKGTFLGIDNWSDADAQILRAEQYISRVLGEPTSHLFAYPYGESTKFLVEEYFPKSWMIHGITAAFRTGGDYVTLGINRWNIPRFVCGEHWTSTEGLIAILDGAKDVTEVRHG